MIGLGRIRTDRTILIGILAAGVTVVAASGWQIATRLGASTTLAPLDLALFRYGVPALLLSPVLMRHGVLPKAVGWRTLVVIIVGAGFPFGLATMAGAQYAPAAHMGALLPGAMPLFVALLSFIVLRERFSPARLVGFGIVILGILPIVGPALSEPANGAWRGHMLFLFAGALWAVYTVVYRRSGLPPWHTAALICFWSSLMAVPVWAASGVSRLSAAPLMDIFVQFAVQGVFAGVIGLAAYGIAIRNLGASLAATSGALVPACTAIGGVFILAEPVDGLAILGVAMTMIGVVLAAGALNLRQLSPRPSQSGSLG